MDSRCSRKTRSRIHRNVSPAVAATVKKRKHSSDDVEDSPPMPKLIQESNIQDTRLNTDSQSLEKVIINVCLFSHVCLYCLAALVLFSLLFSSIVDLKRCFSLTALTDTDSS